MAEGSFQLISTDPRPGSIMILDDNPEKQLEEAASLAGEWKSRKNQLLMMISMNFISFLSALNASILVTVLLVRSEFCILSVTLCLWSLTNRPKAERQFSRSILGRHLIPSYLCHLSAGYRLVFRFARATIATVRLIGLFHYRSRPM